MREFHNWWAPVMWDVDHDDVWSIELYLAEYSKGHRTEPELKLLIKEVYLNSEIL